MNYKAKMTKLIIICQTYEGKFFFTEISIKFLTCMRDEGEWRSGGWGCSKIARILVEIRQTWRVSQMAK